MMLDNETSENAAHWNITDGTTVYATDGEKLGTVRNYNPRAGHIDVRKGWLFTKDFFVPMSDIDTATEDNITLKLTKDELNDDRFNAPPTATPEPVSLTDVSEADIDAVRKQPFEESSTDDAQPAAAGDAKTDTPELADELREDQRFRVR
jgi:uncharacterized protein YrrD